MGDLGPTPGHREIPGEEEAPLQDSGLGNGMGCTDQGSQRAGHERMRELGDFHTHSHKPAGIDDMPPPFLSEFPSSYFFIHSFVIRISVRSTSDRIWKRLRSCY